MEVFNELFSPLNFLVTEFGFVLTNQKMSNEYKGKYLVIFCNEAAEIQVEVSADETWFCCVVRRLIDNLPAKYSDQENVIDIENLALLEDKEYNHSNYVVTGNGLHKVLRSVSELIKRNKKFFTTSEWPDSKRIQKLRREIILESFGLNKNTDVPMHVDSFEQLTLLIEDILVPKGFFICFNSKEEAPYSHKSSVRAIIYTNGKVNIKISQRDWRDEYFLYYLSINDKEVLEFGLLNVSEVFYQIEKIIAEFLP